MNILQLHTSIRNWADWAKQEGLPYYHNIEHIFKKADGSVQLFWSGDRLKGAVQLSALLDSNLTKDVCTRLIGVPITIYYNFNAKIEATLINGEVQSVNSSQLDELHRLQKLKSVQLYIANAMLMDKEIMFAPFDCQQATLKMDPFKTIVLSANNDRKNENKLASSIPVKLKHNLFAITEQNVNEMLEQIKQRLTTPKEAIVTNKVLYYLAALSGGILKSAEQTLNINSMNQSMQSLNPDEKVLAVRPQMEVLDEFMYALQKVDESTLTPENDLKPFVEYLNEIVTKLNLSHINAEFEKLKATIEVDFSNEKEGYEKAKKSFEECLNKQSTKHKALQEEWERVKNPYYFFGDFINFKSKLYQYNEEVPSDVKQELNILLDKGRAYESRCTSLQQMINGLMNTLLTGIYKQKNKMQEAIATYYRDAQTHAHTIQNNHQKNMNVFQKNYEYIHAIFSQIAVSYNEQATIINQQLQQLKALIVDSNKITSLTAQPAIHVEQPEAFQGIKLNPYILKKKHLERFIPNKIDLDFESLEEKIYFRRYKINGAFFLIIVFVVGMFLTNNPSSYANLSDDENEQSYSQDTGNSSTASSVTYDEETSVDSEEETSELSETNYEDFDSNEVEEEDTSQLTEEEEQQLEELFGTTVWDDLVTYELTESEAYNELEYSSFNFITNPADYYDDFNVDVTRNDFSGYEALVYLYSHLMTDVLNLRQDAYALGNYISPYSEQLFLEPELFQKLAANEEGSFELIALNVDASPEFEEGNVYVNQTFRYYAPSGEIKYFSVGANYYITYNGTELQIHDITRY